MFLIKPLRSHLVICEKIQWPVQTNTSVAAISRFLCLWVAVSCTMSRVGIATVFLGIVAVCKFHFVI